TKYLKPLYIKEFINRISINRILVDNGAAMNILSFNLLPKFGKNESRLLPTNVAVRGFSGKITKSNGVLPVQLKVGSYSKIATFFVVITNCSYNALLESDWIHSNWCIPSTLYQKLFLCNDDKQIEVIFADDETFVASSNYVEAKFYNREIGPVRVLGWLLEDDY
ncbi:hypothetical protein CFOL_v3_20753, partial [Cephalotus follicularis]